MVDDGGRGHAELPTELRMRVPAVHAAASGGKRRPARVSAAGIAVRVPVPRGAVPAGAASPAARRHGPFAAACRWPGAARQWSRARCRAAAASCRGSGLLLSKGLVEMHGDTVEALSDGEGCGSEFIVRIPVASSLAQKAEPPVRRPTACFAKALSYSGHRCQCGCCRIAWKTALSAWGLRSHRERRHAGCGNCGRVPPRGPLA